jgi:hypothetical protein
LPNTLCHIGLQLPLLRLIASSRELPWALAGCIIPDLPWIAVKAGIWSGLFDPYDLRLYCTVQASLLGCALLALTVSLLSTRTTRALVIIICSCLLHLLFDSLQRKWGNGVFLLAPFDWQLFQLDLLWPEHPAVLICSLVGLATLLFFWRSMVSSDCWTIRPERRKMALAVLSAMAYLSMPLLFMAQLEREDIYSLQTLRRYEERPGKTIVLDRVAYSSGTRTVKLFSGEELSLSGALAQESGRLSLQGKFLTPEMVEVERYHFHRDRRDMASFVGLFLTCTLVIHSVILANFSRRQPK